MQILTPEIKKALKEAYPDGKLAAVRVGADTFVLRKPTAVEWAQYEEDDSSNSTRNMVEKCVVYPDAPVFQKILEDKYAIYRPLGDVIGKMVGLEKAEEAEVF
jgi:hypothetical protein